MTHKILRRTMLAGALAAALASPASAADDRTVEAKKAFPFLDAYYRIAPAERSRFRVGYLISNDKAAPDMVLVHEGRRTPIPLGRDGKAMRLPTAQELATGQIETSAAAAAGKTKVSMFVEPAVTPASEIDAAAISAAISQAAVSVKKAAPLVLRMAIPKFDQASFRGVASGEVIYGDGRRAALPMPNGRPVFEPAKHPGAKTLRFPSAPYLIVLGS
ncbi:hypothetical protein [Phenylobacterium sp.]|jgi:hypothetical protein|uniref:hypothetical protein n=1 Tax=Phenylobacterium sp. TaxID=1871053 RepID=UPI002F94E857